MIKRVSSIILVIIVSMTFTFAGTMANNSSQKSTKGTAKVKNTKTTTVKSAKGFLKKPSAKKPLAKKPLVKKPSAKKPAAVSKAVTPKPKNVKEKINDVVNNYIDNDSFSGYVLVSMNNSIILDKGIGKADFKKEINNTNETKFNVASITKQFTSFAIMQLEEKNALSVNDNINKYLPNFPFGDKITIHQLLCHTSGLPDYPDDFDIAAHRPFNNKGADKANNDKVKLISEPGDSFLYSNSGYILLGYIIEKVSGKPLDEYFKENIFEPLGMKNTGYNNAENSIKDLAVGYNSVAKDVAPTSWYDINVGYIRGSSGLCTTAKDLIIWESALNEQKLISKASYEKMYKPNLMSYGYGWYINTSPKDNPSYFHYGVGSGYRTYVLRRPSDNLTIILLSNYGDYDMGFVAGQFEVAIN
jgi:CubicO group peptidase (beta-lactamase class C family)